MDFSRLSYFKPLGVILVIVLIFLPLVITAQEVERLPEVDKLVPASEFMEGYNDGKAEAKGSLLWISAGLVANLFGAILLAIYTPDIPVERLIGKSSEYISGYRFGYIERDRVINLMHVGCGAAVNTYFIYEYIKFISGIGG